MAYTYDAGPNACLYLLESEVEEFISLINHVFPKSDDIEDVEYFRGLPLPDNSHNSKVINYLII